MKNTGKKEKGKKKKEKLMKTTGKCFKYGILKLL